MPPYARIATFCAAMIIAACAGEQQADLSADSSARDLTLAPSESTAAMSDAPVNPPAAAPSTPPPPAPRTAPPPTRPRPPATATLPAGTRFDMAAADTITSRTAKVGDPFSARIVEDVKDRNGRIVIPAGSVASGTIAAVKPAPNPDTPGTLTLALARVSIRGKDYPISAAIDSLETAHKGRGVTTGDAAKVGAGAVAGAIIGRVVGGDKKGTIIGGVVGGAVGAGVAATSKDSDIVLPAGAHIIVRLTEPLTVPAS